MQYCLRTAPSHVTEASYELCQSFADDILSSTSTSDTLDLSEKRSLLLFLVTFSEKKSAEVFWLPKFVSLDFALTFKDVI